jgi:hypothetical protein
MGSSTSKLSDVLFSRFPFQLGNNPWHGLELEEYGETKYEPRNTHVIRYPAETPGIIIEYPTTGGAKVVIDGKEFTLSQEQLLTWDVRKPQARNFLEKIEFSREN